jgi:hypothetical protein
MALTERLALLVDARVDGAVKDIRTLAKESGKTDDAAKKLEHRGKAIGTAWKVGVGLVAGAALVKFAQLSGKAVDDASALAETTSKVGAVFKDQGGKILKFGETAAGALGQSRQQALDAAAGFGLFFNAAGLANSASADMSMSLVKLATDLSSFSDVDTPEVLASIRSGLSGEAEPMRKFGVFLNEGAVAAKAAELGLVGLNGKLSDGQKIQARYALILDQTTTQQGDFARTSGGLAGQQRKATAAMADASAALGEGLLPAQLAMTHALVEAAPAISAVAKGTGKLVEGFTSLPGPLQAVVGLTAAFGGGFLLLAPRIAETKKALAELNVTTTATKGKLSSAAGVLSGPWGLAIGAAVTGVGLFWAEQEKAKARVTALTDTLDAQTGAITDNTRELVASQLQQQGVLDQAEKYGLSLDVVTQAALGNADAIRTLQGAQESAIQGARDALAVGADDTMQKQEQARGIQKVVAEILVQSGVLGDAQSKQGQLNEATGKGTAATKGATKALDDNSVALKENIDKMQARRSETLRGLGAEINWQASIDDAQQSLKDNGKTLDISTEKGRANKTALLGMASAWNDLSAKEKNSKGARQAAIGQFVDMATKMGMGEGKARDLARSIIEIPSKKVKVTVDTAEANASIANFLGKWAGSAIPVHIRAPGASTPTPFPGKAVGGPVHANQTYLVGERGPELFRSSQSGMIIPNNKLGSAGRRAMLLSGNGDEMSRVLDSAARGVKEHAKQIVADKQSVKAHAQALREAKASFKESVAGTFAHDIFGKGLAGAMLQLQADKNDANSMTKSLKLTHKLGLKGKAFQALAASGDLTTAKELDTRKEVKQFQAEFDARNHATAAEANFAGNAAFGKHMERQNRTLDRLDKRLAGLEHAVERGSFRGTQRGNDDKNRNGYGQRGH